MAAHQNGRSFPVCTRCYLIVFLCVELVKPSCLLSQQSLTHGPLFVFIYCHMMLVLNRERQEMAVLEGQYLNRDKVIILYTCSIPTSAQYLDFNQQSVSDHTYSFSEFSVIPIYSFFPGIFIHRSFWVSSSKT